MLVYISKGDCQWFEEVEKETHQECAAHWATSATSQRLSAGLWGIGHPIFVWRDGGKVAAPKSFGIKRVVTLKHSNNSVLCITTTGQPHCSLVLIIDSVRNVFVRGRRFRSEGNLFPGISPPVQVPFTSFCHHPPSPLFTLFPLLSCNLCCSDSTAKVQWESAYPSHYPNLPPLFGSTWALSCCD